MACGGTVIYYLESSFGPHAECRQGLLSDDPGKLQSNKLNRMMHHSVEMPSFQVIFLPSA
jgi:hypothetical protein